MSGAPEFTVFTDGSASTLGECAGAYCAVVNYDDCEWVVRGSQVPAKIGGMEIRGVIAALESIVRYMENLPFKFQGVKPEVRVLTDSMYVVNCATGRARRTANRPEWRRFDELASLFTLRIQHTNRNTLPQQALCDQIAGDMRKAAESVQTTALCPN